MKPFTKTDLWAFGVPSRYWFHYIIFFLFLLNEYLDYGTLYQYIKNNCCVRNCFCLEYWQGLETVRHNTHSMAMVIRYSITFFNQKTISSIKQLQYVVNLLCMNHIAFRSVVPIRILERAKYYFWKLLPGGMQWINLKLCILHNIDWRRIYFSPGTRV